MTTFYVDNTLHTADNAVGTATGGGNDYILLEVHGSQEDDEFNGYGIRITGGTGVGQQRRIIDYVHTGHGSGERYAQVETNWSVNPNATSTYEITVGCDQNDGVAEGIYGGAHGALATPGKGSDLILALGTGGHVVYVRAGRSYTTEHGSSSAIFRVLSLGTAGLPNRLAGYLVTPGDSDAHPGDGTYRAVFEASDESLDHAIDQNPGLSGAFYWVFENVRASGGADVGIALSAGDYVTLRNVRSDSNVGYGIEVDENATLELVIADLNGSYGIVIGNGGACLVGCQAIDNDGARQLNLKGGTIFASIVFGMPTGGYGIYCDTTSAPLTVINSVIDGEGASSTTGIYAKGLLHVVNTPIYRVTTQVNCLTDHGRLSCSRNNAVAATPAYTNFATHIGEVATDAPKFTDWAGCVYSLQADSPLKAAGFPGALGPGTYLDGEVGYMDIGPLQRNEGRAPAGWPNEAGVQE